MKADMFRLDGKVVAVAPDWPGLSRGAKTGEAAIERLLAYRPRYHGHEQGYDLVLLVPRRWPRHSSGASVSSGSTG